MKQYALNFLLLYSIATAALGSAQTRVSVDSGILEGKLSADGRVRSFLGVPYAAPPVGELRWKPPQPVAAWAVPRGAASFGSHCMQLPIFKDMRFRDPGQSEVCLTLNVWAPRESGKKGLPVMVWIHGGGYNGGGSSEPRQDGEHLARLGVVVVSMNYRLGMFGFLAHHELAAESASGATGNYGLMDQVAALRWVQHNIAAFGGDPAQVTVFGESAGSMSVSALIASPLAKGLFVRAIGESGGAFSVTGIVFPPKAVSEWQDEAFLAAAFGAQTTLAELRKMSAQDLLAATASRPDTPLFAPDIDGVFLPRPVAEIYAGGTPSQVPVLAGWNRNEARQTSPAVQSPAQLQDLALARFGPNAAEFLRLYFPPNTPPAQAADDLAADRFIAYGTWRWLEASARSGVPVYRYELDLGSPGDAFHAPGDAFHSDDIEYVFGTLDSRVGAHWRPEDYALSKLMQRYWVNFATTGRPDGSGTPAWPAYSAATQWSVLHLDAASHAEADAHRDRYQFLTRVWGTAPQVTPSR